MRKFTFEQAVIAIATEVEEYADDIAFGLGLTTDELGLVHADDIHLVDATKEHPTKLWLHNKTGIFVEAK